MGKARALLVQGVDSPEDYTMHLHDAHFISHANVDVDIARLERTLNQLSRAPSNDHLAQDALEHVEALRLDIAKHLNAETFETAIGSQVDLDGKRRDRFGAYRLAMVDALGALRWALVDLRRAGRDRQAAMRVVNDAFDRLSIAFAGHMGQSLQSFDHYEDLLG
jgi:hypothetical protein